MLMALSMAQLHFLVQDNQNEVHHNIFGHMMPLVLALPSHDSDNITNGTITFFTLGYDWNQVKHDFSGHTTPLHWHHIILTVLSIVPLQSIGQHSQNEVQHDSFGHVMPLAPLLESSDANDITNSHIIGICPWTTMSVTLHTYVPLHFYCSLHINCILLHTQVIKNNNSNF